MKAVFSILIAMFCISTIAQNQKIKGSVSHYNEPVPFAEVYIKNTNVGTTTDIEGHFKRYTKRKYCFNRSSDWVQKMGTKIDNNDKLKSLKISLKKMFWD